MAMGEWKYVQRHLFLQERQRNVTLRRVLTTKAAVEKQYVLHILYAACNAHVSYRHLWSVRLLRHFSTLCHKRHDFRKKKNKSC